MMYNENWGPHDATPNWYIPNLILDIERIFAQLELGTSSYELCMFVAAFHALPLRIRAGDQQLREPYQPRCQ